MTNVSCALNEIKRISNRIQKIVDYGSFIDISRKNVNRELFSETCKSDWQSLKDLIHLRNSLRRAIIKSDSTTIVKIGNETMCITEVLERKKSIVTHIRLLENLKSKRDSILKSIDVDIDILDPINIDNRIDNLELYINNFIQEIKIVLSESNTSTMITI